jgi:hypothetical protein
MIPILPENSLSISYGIMKINLFFICQGVIHSIVKTLHRAKLNSAPEFIRIWTRPAVLLLWLTVVLFILSARESGFASEIAPIGVRQVNNELFATSTLQPDQKLVDDLGSGLSKEIVFYVDLFRHWKVWPDEFVLGRKIVRVLQSDPIRREYIGSNTEGNIRTIKRFKDLDTMIAWAMNINDLKLTNVKALETGDYYIKISAESILKKLPPVVETVIFWVSTKEFSVYKDSPLFRIPSAQADR